MRPVPPPARPTAAWIGLAATLAYAAVLVWATHHPKPQDILGPKVPPDKLLHVTAYAVLAALAAGTLAATGRWTPAAIARLGAGLAVFGAIDEITQPLPWFRRAADPLDWVFDVAGIAAGIAVAALVRAVVLRLCAGPDQ